ncbi:lipoyl synthase [Breznakiella homolactica]|uniref:Lipoyl synthase n=1 Tax=Breznakiella homolactica TaxID=2798577 RepID=A0A7T8B8G5_9SPIR|nr:lipoyl synthase [Breznakiella homolactica]QQO07367.1 lipoyl synthase [Breznakiella homolactica]
MGNSIPVLRKPDWIRVTVPAGQTWRYVDGILRKRNLHTVCDEAKCPNKGECWGAGTATFMIMGDTCTRGCRFCAVKTARSGESLRQDEGEALALAAAELGLRYLVLTSVDRDDLADQGAGHFASCIRAVKKHVPEIKTEALIPDFSDEALAVLLSAGPDVVAHNVETVRSLQAVRDPRATFDRSLQTLTNAKKLGAPLTKSSLILGLGEKEEEVLSAMDELRSAGVDILVMGQYLQPTAKQIPVAEYVSPEQFKAYAREAWSRGFTSVVSSPFARTSYHAADSAGTAR